MATMTDTLSTSPLPISEPEAFAVRTAMEIRPSEAFAQKQAEAWEKYRSLPFPTRTHEAWRFSNLNQVRELETFVPTAMEGVDRDDLIQKSKRLGEVSGRFVFVDDNLATAREFDPQLSEQGVIFTTLFDALNQHPELVESYLLKESPELGSEKFEALHVAMLRSGVFLYIPDEVKVEKPFVIHQWNAKDKGAIFPHTLFVCGKNASAQLIEFQESADKDTEHLVIANTHLHAEEGAKPVHTIVQNWNLQTLSFQLNTSNAQSQVASQSTLINLGSSFARQEVHGKIFGSEANVNLYSLNLPGGNQLFDQRTLQTHIAPNSRSDLLFKNALREDSKTIFSGLIIVEENAQKTDAYQTNNNLMLSETAEANSLPGLEIKANDVKCSHGATTGQIDDSEIFYFLARGIPRETAEQLMVFGFCEEIIEKCPNEELAGLIRDSVEARINS